MCVRLEVIPLLPNLEKLICEFCDSLKVIHELPNLIAIKCCRCKLLTHIPVLPNIQYIEYSHDTVTSYIVPLRFLHNLDIDILIN